MGVVLAFTDTTVITLQATGTKLVATTLHTSCVAEAVGIFLAKKPTKFHL
jgi:hypothetical protein